MKAVLIGSLQEVDDYEARVVRAAAVAVERLFTMPERGVDFLRRMRFDEIGRHPLEDRDLNLIEQVNQTYSLLVTFKALRFLFGQHPDVVRYKVTLGPVRGYDIQSADGEEVVAEVFAAVEPSSNSKVTLDRDKVAKSTGKHKYVFFFCPGYSAGRQARYERDGVQVWAVAV
jgi:hypothetical protein